MIVKEKGGDNTVIEKRESATLLRMWYLMKLLHGGLQIKKCFQNEADLGFCE